jgi:hypothetical protein
VKINLNPTYISDTSYAKKQPIPIDINLDPTANSITAPFKQARQSGYISPIGANKNSGAMLLALQNATTFSFSNPNPGDANGKGTSTPEAGSSPLRVTNLHASWEGQKIKLTFDFDLTDPQNAFFERIGVQLHSISANAYLTVTEKVLYSAALLSKSSSSQTLYVDYPDQCTTGKFLQGDFDGVGVATYDTAQQTDGFVTTTLAAPVCDLPAPVITSSNGTSSYAVTTSNLSTAKAISDFLTEAIQEYITTETSESAIHAADSAGTSVWTTVNESTFSPASIYANDGLHRWVRAFFISTSGLRSVYSNYVEATPQPLIQNNTLPPSGVSNVSAAFSNSGAGDNIVVSYTLPTIVDTDPNKLVSLKVKLVPTASNGLSGFFYHTVAANETSFTIPSNLIFAQFGQYFSSYSGTVVGVSQYGTESSNAANISTFSRTNALASVTPTAVLTNVVDGYNVQFSLANSGATYGEVYQFFINPGFSTNDIPNYADFSYLSGGSSGQKTLVINSVSMENGNFTPPTGKTFNDYIGYGITGTGIPDNTWVTSISGSGPSYTLTLNNNLTAQASGKYHMQSLVYSGTGPANIFENYYGSLYVLVTYYDQYGNRSNNSQVYTATPTNPATSVISNAVQIGSGGSIYVGTSATTGSRIVLGPSGNKGPDGSSAYSGIFAFDYGSTSSSAASTAIITNPGASSYTFETTNAKIADWSINGTQIQNTLGSASNYVGLSATGTYSFWAGSTTSGGDSSAKFSVTPGGKVSARDITIYGSGNNSDTLLSAGAYFTVKGDGTVTASNATITGHLNVSQSSTFTSDITLSGGNAYLLALASGSTIASGASMQIASNGLVAYDSSHTPTTQITATPDGSGVSFSTTKAYLGSSTSSNAWIVTNGLIYSGNMDLSSSGQHISIYPTLNGAKVTTSGVRMQGNDVNSKAFVVGLFSDPAFYINYDGSMTATNAKITGVISGGSKTGIADGNAGYYLARTGEVDFGNSSQYIRYSGSAITLQANSSRINGVGSPGADGTSAYAGPSSLVLKSDGVTLSGLPITGNMDMYQYYTYYRNASPLGPIPRARMVVEDPVSGRMELGMAIYMADSSAHSSTPGGSSGYVGDLWVQY